MPPTRTATKAASRAAARAQTDNRSGFSRAVGRFRAGARPQSNRTGGGITSLLRDTRQELKKVEWPNREELTKLTAAVVALSAIVGIFLGGVDYVFQEFFKVIISAWNGGA